jgi:hypothetical protein
MILHIINIDNARKNHFLVIFDQIVFQKQMHDDRIVLKSWFLSLLMKFYTIKFADLVGALTYCSMYEAVAA